MTVAQLARLNRISTNATLQPGQRLQVSGSRGQPGTQPPVTAGKVAYRVKNGDTLSGIARRFAVTVRQLQAWNNMGRSTILRAGQSLTIHVGS
jgi:membrane-bound lytic murein transglycosylase D